MPQNYEASCSNDLLLSPCLSEKQHLLASRRLKRVKDKKTCCDSPSLPVSHSESDVTMHQHFPSILSACIDRHTGHPSKFEPVRGAPSSPIVCLLSRCGTMAAAPPAPPQPDFHQLNQHLAGVFEQIGEYRTWSA